MGSFPAYAGQSLTRLPGKEAGFRKMGGLNSALRGGISGNIGGYPAL